MKNAFVLLLGLLIAVSACKTTKKMTSDQPKAKPVGVDPALVDAQKKAVNYGDPSDTTSIVLIDTTSLENLSIIASIKRTNCYGKCPSYEAKLYSNGTVVYEGKAHTAKLGLFEAYLLKPQIDSLFALADAMNFFELASFYPTNGKKLSDLPETHTYLKVGENEKTIINNHNSPKDLRLLESYLDELLADLEWNEIQTER